MTCGALAGNILEARISEAHCQWRFSAWPLALPIPNQLEKNLFGQLKLVDPVRSPFPGALQRRHMIIRDAKPSGSPMVTRIRSCTAWVVVTAVVITTLFAQKSSWGFSDSLLLAEQAAASPRPYYNVAYLPTAWSACQLGEAWGVSAEWSMILLSRVCSLLSLSLTYMLLRRWGISRAPSALAVSLAWSAPAALFFGAVVEVHGLATLGASSALLVASARWGNPAIRMLLGCAIGLFFHQSHLLLFPAIIAIALGASTNHDPLGRRALVGLAVALLGCLGAGIVVSSLDLEQWAQVPFLGALGMVGVHIRGFAEAIVVRGTFSLAETAGYIWSEWVIALGPASFFIGLAGLVSLRIPLAKRWLPHFLLLSIAAAIVALSQGGIWERGGYALSYLPLLAIGIGCTLQKFQGLWVSLALALFVAAQLSLGHAGLLRYIKNTAAYSNQAAEMVAHAAPGDCILVGSLNMQMAINLKRSGVIAYNLRRAFQSTPSRLHEKHIASILSERRRNLPPGGTLWVSINVLDAMSHPGWAQDLQGLLKRYNAGVTITKPSTPLGAVNFSNGPAPNRNH